MDLRIRDIPVDLRGELKAEAALKGITLNDYVIELLKNREPENGSTTMNWRKR
jgi:predicted HicB family RNase H-like nuclease